MPVPDLIAAARAITWRRYGAIVCVYTLADAFPRGVTLDAAELGERGAA